MSGEKHDTRRPTTEEIEALRIAAEAQRVLYVKAEMAHQAAQRAGYKFQPGDVIRSADGDLALVKEVRISYGKPEVVAVMQRKDGTWGERQVSMWRQVWSASTLVENVNAG